MLKGIPQILSPELLKTLMEMGHGDEIVLADGNFPAAALAERLIRCDGHSIPDLLDAILTLMPLDTYVEKPVCLMEVVPGDNTKPIIWDQYGQIIQTRTGKTPAFQFIERFSFYERAKKAFAIAATGEKALYANMILKKGVVVD